MTGLKVLVTRPLIQGQKLAQRLSSEGFVPVVSPMIKIVALEGEELMAQLEHLKNLSTADGAIAISSNAFSLANQILRQERIQGGVKVPANLTWFAVGNATADAMREASIEPVTPKRRFDTEGLLGLQEFQELSGKRFVLFAGRGGRRKLEDVLRARGAELNRVELYKRAPLGSSEISVSQEPDALIAMSGETVSAISGYLEGERLIDWFNKPLVVPSARVAEIAFDAGFTKLRMTEKASEESLIQALSRLATEV